MSGRSASAPAKKAAAARARKARPSTPPTPHDALFKAIFSKVVHARAMLRSELPPALAAAVTWSTLKRRPGSFVDDTLRQQHTDLLFTAKMQGRNAYFYLLCEHQSTADRWMLVRLLQYMVRIWQEHIDRHPNATLLPVIVPVVVHHSDSGWTFATAFEALLDIDAALWPEVKPFVPRFGFILDDVSNADDDELRGRALTALGKIALACFRHSRDIQTLLANLGAWTETLDDVRSSAHGLRAWALVLRYILTVAGNLDTRQLRALTESTGDPRATEEIVTLVERLEKEGFDKGMQKGTSELLLKLLRLKFRKLPAAAVARVRAADQTQIDRWAERVLTAGSLAEILDA